MFSQRIVCTVSIYTFSTSLQDRVLTVESLVATKETSECFYECSNTCEQLYRVYIPYEITFHWQIVDDISFLSMQNRNCSLFKRYLRQNCNKKMSKRFFPEISFNATFKKNTRISSRSMFNPFCLGMKRNRMHSVQKSHNDTILLLIEKLFS